MLVIVDECQRFHSFLNELVFDFKFTGTGYSKLFHGYLITVHLPKFLATHARKETNVLFIKYHHLRC